MWLKKYEEDSIDPENENQYLSIIIKLVECAVLGELLGVYHVKCFQVLPLEKLRSPNWLGLYAMTSKNNIHTFAFMTARNALEIRRKRVSYILSLLPRHFWSYT